MGPAYSVPKRRMNKSINQSIKNDDQEVLSQQIVLQCTNFEFNQHDKFLMKIIKFINFVYNFVRKNIRSIHKLLSIRAKLKLRAFSRNYLRSQLKHDVISLSFIVFVDEFEFYRNMYKFFTEMYVVSVELSAIERQKSYNVYIITLESHESNFNDIMNCFCIIIKFMNRECVLDIKNRKRVA